jgi:hypothetical protein
LICPVSGSVILLDAALYIIFGVAITHDITLEYRKTSSVRLDSMTASCWLVFYGCQALSHLALHENTFHHRLERETESLESLKIQMSINAILVR